MKRVAWLHEGWELARASPGAVPDPAALAGAPLEWHRAQVPGTVASALRHDPDLPGPFDGDDWWYRLRFEAPERRAGVRHRLRFEGLATLAQVWLNGEPLLSSRNMFAPCAADVTDRLRETNELAIRFASLEAAPVPKRPRARWKSALVSRPCLRALRTTLLGRMPGWTPVVDPVGPWGTVALESIERLDLESLELHATVKGETPHLRIDARIAPLDGVRIEEARVRIDGRSHALAIGQGDVVRVQGESAVPDAPIWWPHTHGVPSLVPCALEVRVDDEWIAFDAGRVGFRRIDLDEKDGRVRFAVNGVPVFCRGACWTPLDILRLHAEPEALRSALVQLRDAGANMLRIPGNTVYESEDFYRLCDELGILVWQDFMFANLDYPVADARFRADVEEEARALLERLHAHPCLAAYCGGSEVAQQAAMLGLPAEAWSNELFTDRLPGLIKELHPGIPYFPSTPWGGALPFHPGEGIAHYYGVGAYRRPLSDARLAQVKFAAECLAFSQVPEEESLERAFGTATPAPHHPRWKARQPRDNGAGWDFEDVRDHYLRELFHVDPVALRSRDVARYLALSRAVPGELMRRVFAEWRSSSSTCGGALVWLHRDLVPGAGWGIVDAYGRPKSAYWYIKRAWAPRAVHVTDEGLNGLAIHVVNESAEPLAATVELELARADGVVLDSARHGVLVPARATFTFNSEAMLGHFADSTAAYRFGPARHGVAIARLADVEGRTLAEDFHFPEGLDLPMLGAAPVRTEVRWLEGGRVAATVIADAFLQDVCIACEGFAPDDNHFHLAPGREKRLVFQPLGAGVERFEARLEALNLAVPLRLRAGRDAKDRAA